MKSYKDLRKYVVKNYGKTAAKAMDKGKWKGGKEPQLSEVLMLKVGWIDCSPFPMFFWSEMFDRLEYLEHKAEKRKAAKRKAAKRKAAKRKAAKRKAAKRKAEAEEVKEEGRLDALVRLREEIKKRRGEEAARVYDDNFSVDSSTRTKSMDLALFDSLRWKKAFVFETSSEPCDFWCELFVELEAENL